MTAVPVTLLASFDEWKARDCPPQPAFEWKTEQWRRWLPDQEMLGILGNPIDRIEVTNWFEHLDSPADALNAYVATYVWGYAHANNGPFRASRVIRANTAAPNGRHFGDDLLELASIAQGQGGVAAFQHVVAARRKDAGFFKWWGPAFATKYISFATKAAPSRFGVETAPIMDRIVASWFRRNCPDAKPLVLDWSSSDSYRRYTECLAGWADQLHTTSDQVEHLIFSAS